MITKMKKRGKYPVEYHAVAICALFLLMCLILNLLGKVLYVFTAASFVVFLFAGIIWAYFKQSRKDKIVTLLIFVIVLSVLTPFIKYRPGSANDQSRLGTMDGLVESNHFELGRGFTHDKVQLDGKFYSSKPPVLSFIGAGVYWMVRGVMGLFGHEVKRPQLVYFWITLFLITIPIALSAALFYKILAFTKIKEYYRYILVFAFIFGTLMFTYSGVINNHTAAVTTLVAGFYLFYCARFYNSKGAAAASGFFFALSATFDLPSLIWFAVFGAYFLFTKKYQFLLWYTLGALLPFIFHFSFQYEITGNFKPQYMQGGDSYHWKGSPWKGLSRGARPVWYAYLWKFTFGNRGLFVYTPLFIISLLGLGSLLRNRKHRFWKEGICLLSGFIVLFAFYALRGGKDFGGNAYGFRWLIPMIPFLIFSLAFIFENPKRSKWIDLVFLVLLIYSAYLAYIGLPFVWKTHPPLFWISYHLA